MDPRPKEPRGHPWPHRLFMWVALAGFILWGAYAGSVGSGPYVFVSGSLATWFLVEGALSVEMRRAVREGAAQVKTR